MKAHSGKPLNEAADALAGAGARMDPTKDVDPEGVYFYYRDTLVP